MTSIIEIIAHRGNGGRARENTVLAIQDVLQGGRTSIEIDVHLTKDGVAIVHHDHVLNPKVTRHIGNHTPCQLDLPIEQLTLAEIQAHEIIETTNDAGEALTWGPIPLLSDVLDMWQQAKPEQRIFLELKSSPEELKWRTDPRPMGRKIVDLIKQREMVEKVAILSFDWMVFEVFRDLLPNLARYHLTFPAPRNDLPWPPHIIERLRVAQSNKAIFCGEFSPDRLNCTMAEAIIRADGQGWSSYLDDLDNDAVSLMHELGGKVAAWTAKSPEDIRRLIEIGVDMIITDNAILALEILMEHDKCFINGSAS